VFNDKSTIYTVCNEANGTVKRLLVTVLRDVDQRMTGEKEQDDHKKKKKRKQLEHSVSIVKERKQLQHPTATASPQYTLAVAKSRPSSCRAMA
jgi:hypothetical protein